MKTIDEARAAHPTLGFCLYAIDPAEPMTLEVHTPDGQVFSWSGPTEEAVLFLAFPEDVSADPVGEDERPEPTIDIFE
jgi:hypothetical protein